MFFSLWILYDTLEANVLYFAEQVKREEVDTHLLISDLREQHFCPGEGSVLIAFSSG